MPVRGSCSAHGRDRPWVAGRNAGTAIPRTAPVRRPPADRSTFSSSPFQLLEPRAGLRTDANPIEAVGSRDGSVSLNGDFETACVQGIDHLLVELQQWLAAGCKRQNRFEPSGVRRPIPFDGRRQRFGRGKVAAATTVGIGKIGVAELANRRGTVLLASRPEVTSGKYGKRPPGGPYARPSPCRV